jgi:hypothetical protein
MASRDETGTAMATKIETADTTTTTTITTTAETGERAVAGMGPVMGVTGRSLYT